ncbi:MAG: DUF6159 family protein [Actinomycetales bacterium]
MVTRSFAQSRVLTKKSWSIIRQNRYLLAFPVLGFLCSLVPLAALWIPAAVCFLANNNVAGAVLAVLGVFANQIVISISGGALVAAADAEFANGSSSVGRGLGRAFARIIPLIGWALVATVVNVIVGLIRGRGGNGAADALRNLAAAGVLAMWQLVTYFVLPHIMLEGSGPIAAIKQSFALFKQTWGTQIFGGVRIGGMVGLVTILPGILLVVLGIVLATLDSAASIGIGAGLIVIGVLLFMAGALLLSTMRGIFSVVLYRYAKDGSTCGDFTADELAGAVRTSK